MPPGRRPQITRLPTESRDYVGLEGPEYESYKVGPKCSVPGCTKFADHTHHIVRRSELGGPFLWVRMPDGVEIGNVTGLCWRHHDDVTVNSERITYVDGLYLWTDGTPLTQQPPMKGFEREEIEHEHLTEEERGVCPTCHRKLPKPKVETDQEEKKPRGTWAVAIPMDERENGADTLDALLEAARDELDKVGLSYGDGSKVKFYILSAALGLFVQHATEVLSNS